MSFKDHFSGRADAYARHRPHYPAELFDRLAAATPLRTLAWDCAAGSGQAALDLRTRYEHVVATDASPQQIAAAPRHPDLGRAAALAEAAPLAAGCADLVTVAQALHWLDLDRFWPEVRRVLRPGGVIAAWAYGLCHVTPAVDALVEHYYRDTVGPYWPRERARVEAGYADLPFPFERLYLPPIAMQAEWTVEAMLGFLGTWSATARFQAERGFDPVAELTPSLAARWGDARRCIRWPLAVIAGRA